jgi:4-azaleucine resistance transporter AzlC
MELQETPGQLGIRDGIRDGLPICIGYAPTAMAFAIICRSTGLRNWETVLFSATNFAGSGQFLAINLLASGALLAELFVGVYLISLRYTFMGAAICAKMENGIRGIKRLVIAHGTTDEIFSVAVLHNGMLSSSYLLALEATAYIGWVGGTAVGFFVGMVLPHALQLAIGVTLYAMFSSLFAQELRQKGMAVLAIAATSAALDSLFVCVLRMGTGWSFVLAMVLASCFGALVFDDLAEATA